MSEDFCEVKVFGIPVERVCAEVRALLSVYRDPEESPVVYGGDEFGIVQTKKQSNRKNRLTQGGGFATGWE